MGVRRGKEQFVGLLDGLSGRWGDTGETGKVGEVGKVRLVNALGARWARELAYDGGDGQVWTALGVWPLLAALGAGATGAARAELEQALGLPAEHAAELARELLDGVRRIPGCGAALGLWTAGDLAVEPAWADALGRSAWGRLTGETDKDRETLDSWAAERTGGLIPRMPLGDLTGMLLVLASAVTVRTRWATPFRAARFPVSEGPWAGRQFEKLTVNSPELYDRISVAETEAGPVTEVRVVGADEVDVHLVLGTPGAAPGAVVAAGFELVAGEEWRMPVEGLADGEEGWPGLELTTRESVVPRNTGVLETVGFTVRAEHDLLAQADLFGLRTAAGPGSHFPGISRSTPLRVSQAKQSATAEFSAEGFKGGAVTAVGMTRGATGLPGKFRTRHATARFDRPFAFLAVHRATGLILLAGWVTNPTAGR